MLRRLKRISVIILSPVLFIILAAFIALSMYDSPEYAWRLLRYGQSDINDYLIFPERVIQNGEKVSVLEKIEGSLPRTISWHDPIMKQERVEKLPELFELTATNAFILLRDDRVVYERYFNGTGPESIHTSFSATKSFVSALIGAAIADGSIASVDDPVIQYIPELAGRGLDSLTIRDLLLMNSGIRYEYNRDLPFYKHPFGDDSLTYYSPDLRKTALRVEADGKPIGKTFHYNNYHLLLEGMILERSTGMSVSEYMQEKIWKPMGAEYPASWSLDSEESGFEKMESGINARVLDYARFGSIFLHNGFWNDAQILPEEWVYESTSPIQRDWGLEVLNDGKWYYKYHWVGLQNGDGTYDFYAHGHFEQLVYVAPRKNVVIVRLGDATDYPVAWNLIFQSLVDQIE
ncbi:MAG: beta-lactamase family protein [Anaerolineales bacterium]|nr:beta-lactamase family protein [Anaerolineales bacterium]